MAKKIKVDLKTAGAEPAAGDVNISYKGSRIAGLSESSTAVLETEDTIVQDDIEVEYTKPTGGSIGNVLNCTNNTSRKHTVSSVLPNGIGNIIVNNQIRNVSLAANTSENGIVLCYQDSEKYYVVLTVPSLNDDRNVTVNGTPLTYTDGKYRFISSASNDVIVGQTYNVVISNKE